MLIWGLERESVATICKYGADQVLNAKISYVFWRYRPISVRRMLTAGIDRAQIIVGYCKGVGGGIVMVNRTERQATGTSIVRVQVLIIAGGVRLLKRFAEAIRDAARADALVPVLPNIADIDEDDQADVSLVRISVFVPSSSVAKVKAYARMIRNSARSGMPLPRFTLATSRQEAKPPAQEGAVQNSCSQDQDTQNPVDLAKLRKVMRTAREARYV